MAIQTTSQFADSVDPSFREIFDGGYKEKASVLERVFNVATSKQAWEKVSAVTGLSTVPAKPEGTDVVYDQRYQGYDKTFTHITYALGFQITQELIEDELYGVMADTPAALGRSVRASREILAASHFNNAFSGSYTGPDSLALCHTAHTAEDGSARTFANNATAAVLSHSAIISARTRMRKMTDPRGLNIELMPSMLLIPPDLEETAFIVTKTERVSGSANWDKSLLAGSLEPVIWNDLTSTTAWFMLADKPNHGMIWFDRIAPQLTRDSEFDKDVAKWKTRYRCISGWKQWRGVDGNAGA